MGFIEDCEKHFATKNLYEIMGVESSANDAAIKKAYRKQSLKYHPDRCEVVNDQQKIEITAKFQVLAKVHSILSDKEKRAVYDETGLVADDDTIAGDADWMEYWRLLFPKITSTDITQFYDKYIGSDEEKEDLKKVYLRFEGDMDMIYESMIGFEEQRTREMLQAMIDSGEIPEFESFTKETADKKSKRMKRAKKESKEAEKAKKDERMDDLVNAIQSRSASNFNDMVSQLEAKYATRRYEKRDKKVSNTVPKKQKRK